MAYSPTSTASYLPDSLLPDWYYDILIVGTHTPSITPEGKALPSFYSSPESSHFWDLLPEIFSGQKLGNQPENWLPFLQQHQIGLTDLLVHATAPASEQTCSCHTGYKDELIWPSQTAWNTPAILKKIKENKISAVFITNMNASEAMEAEIDKIRSAARINEIYFGRLAHPSVEAALPFHESALYYPNLFTNWFDSFSPVIQVRVR